MVKNLNFSFISPFENDPFVGHLNTPFSNSQIITNYLFKLPIYSKNLSSLLKGIIIGGMHGYFLFGPFFVFSPMRYKETNLLLSSLTTISLFLILTFTLVLYTKVSIKLKNNFLFNWNQFNVGFFNGALLGIVLVFLILNLIN